MVTLSEKQELRVLGNWQKIIELSFKVDLFVLRPTTEQVWHKAFIKVGLDAGLQPTRVWQNPKIPLAPSALPQQGRFRHQQTKQQTIGKVDNYPSGFYSNIRNF